MTNYHSNIAGHFNRISLNVTQLNEITDFYVLMIGMSVISRSDSHVILGVENRVLLTLYQSDSTQRNTGLYHFALLLPDRQSLAIILLHLVKHNIPLQGASDHIISEAIYLSDPEGNGIEIVVDRDSSFWPFEYGKLNILGQNGPLDVNNLLLEVDRDVSFEHLPNQTIVGHVHIHVHSIEKSRKFYENIFNMKTTIDIPKRALFLANNNYHHHLAMNLWKHHEHVNQTLSNLGLNTLYYKLPKSYSLESLIEILKTYHYPFDTLKEGISLFDPANIHLFISK